jgi:hypothetical protein
MCFISFLSLFKLIISYNMDSDKAGRVIRGMAGGDHLEKERHINFKGSAIDIVGKCMAKVNFKGSAIETIGRCMAQVDECYLVLFHTPWFMFVGPLALLIFNKLTCFVCFVINRPLHHVLIEGAKMDIK